jgi:hypothetical protein
VVVAQELLAEVHLRALLVVVEMALHQRSLEHQQHMLVVAVVRVISLHMEMALVEQVVEVMAKKGHRLLLPLEQLVLAEAVVAAHILLVDLQAAAALSSSSIQKQFHHLQMPQTLGCLDLLALGQHQQEHQMLIM